MRLYVVGVVSCSDVAKIQSSIPRGLNLIDVRAIVSNLGLLGYICTIAEYTGKFLTNVLTLTLALTSVEQQGLAPPKLHFPLSYVAVIVSGDCHQH